MHKDKTDELTKEYENEPELIAAMLESQPFKIPQGESFGDLYELRFKAGNGIRIDKATLNLRPDRVGALDVIGNAYEYLIKAYMEAVFSPK